MHCSVKDFMEFHCLMFASTNWVFHQITLHSEIAGVTPKGSRFCVQLHRIYIQEDMDQCKGFVIFILLNACCFIIPFFFLQVTTSHIYNFGSMSSLSRELVFLILQFLDEEKFKETVHK